jgi:hypothetical protein
MVLYFSEKNFNSRFHKNKLKLKSELVSILVGEERKSKIFRVHGDPEAQAVPPM